ncbi:hypothetical protein Tco_0685222 [Tanacetum coccineum]
MANSLKGIDWSKLAVTKEMVDYVLAKYRNKWEVDEPIADVILDDLLQKTFDEPKLMKDDKGKGKGTLNSQLSMSEKEEPKPLDVLQTEEQDLIPLDILYLNLEIASTSRDTAGGIASTILNLGHVRLGDV